MPCIMELEYRISVIDKKIEELKHIISIEGSNEVADRLMLLLDQKRDILTDINSANSLVLIPIFDDLIHISKINIIIDSIDEKIDTLTKLITDRNNNLDKIKLQDQRDRFYNDKILLLIEVNRHKLNVRVG